MLTINIQGWHPAFRIRGSILSDHRGLTHPRLPDSTTANFETQPASIATYSHLQLHLTCKSIDSNLLSCEVFNGIIPVFATTALLKLES
jgi:hypothetical protein